MKRQAISLITLCFMLFSLLLNTLVVPYASAQTIEVFSSDIDSDGLLNELETAGWYNNSGGPFNTDPLDADSDDDGLSDGEEKLFDTDPLDYKSPGLYVRYQDSYYTKEYFHTTDPAYLSMKQAGDRYLMAEAMVARRGTTLHIGGSISGTLSMVDSAWDDPNYPGTPPALDSLSPQKNIHGGGWTVDLPSTSGGTTGTYIATLAITGQDPITMPIHIIFEIPEAVVTSEYISTLSSDDIAAFLYNNDPSDERDETAVVWRTREGTFSKDVYTTTYTYKKPSGWAQAFTTDQYQKYIFLDRVMPRIQGLTSQNDATDKLSNKADEEVRVDYNWYKTYDIAQTLEKTQVITGWTQPGYPCQNQAGTFTSFLRAAGIPATPFIIDWKNASDDHAVQIWFDGQWMAGRSYRGGEHGNSAYQYYPFERGHTSDTVLSNWDNQGYTDSKGLSLFTVNNNWDFEVWGPKAGSCPAEAVGENKHGDECFLGGMVTRDKFQPDPRMTTESKDYQYVAYRPLQMKVMHPTVRTLNTIIWDNDPWVPTFPPWPDAYELEEHPNYPAGPYTQNWPIEPVPQSCPAGFLGTCTYSISGFETLDFDDEEDQLAPQTQLDPQFQSDLIQIENIVDDYGLDTDGNGRFDKLIVEIEVTALQAGNYTFSGKLFVPSETTAYGDGVIYPNTLSTYLPAGTQTIQLSFEGLAIGNAGAAGPYTLTDLWVTNIEDFDSRLGPWDNLLVSQYPNFTTTPYSIDQFEVLKASLADIYNHYGLDNDGDGKYETVAIDVSLDIAVPGDTYRLEGDLYDGQGNFVDHNSWSGSGSIASLTFGIEQTTPPYQLKNLRLSETNGFPLDSRSHEVYTIADIGSQVDQGPVTMDIYAPSSGGLGIMGVNITPTLVFSNTGVDLNSNSLFDQLRVDVQVQISLPDQYRIEGWLEDSNGDLIVYSISDPTSLGVGTDTLSLSFDGRAINGHKVDGPYTVVALRILGDTTYDVLDEVKETGLSLSYTANQFETEGVASIFNDDMENGTAKWSSAQTPWNHAAKSWPNTSQVWEADSTFQDGLLTTISINDTANYANLLLRYENTYQMAHGSDVGYVEASTNGAVWTKVATYTNSANRQEIAMLDISNFDESSNLQIRFNANSTTSLTWDIDNVYLNGWPAVTDASFDYAPKPLVASQNTVLTATYTSITTTLPVTYTWDFGDGTIESSNNFTISHTFADDQDYTVVLTVENPYDDEVTTKVVGVGYPITGTSFSYEPANPDTTTVISFAASYMPNTGSISATNSITHPIVYEWDFGDGSNVITSTNPVVTHTYSAGGNYPVQLKTSNGFGTAFANQNVPIKEGVSGVTFSTSGTYIEDDLVDFQPEITPTTATQPVTYTWNFGDGSSPVVTTTSSIQHVFAAPASYTVWITADNGYGSPVVYSDTVVIDGRPVLTTSFIYAQTLANAQNHPNEATFIASYGPYNATQPVTYTWNFGDGSATTTPTQNPSITHTFTSTSTFTVWVTTTNGYSTPVSYSQIITLPFDNDGDGLSNAQELSLGTDMNDPDTDGDGRTDSEEVNGYVYTGTVYLDHNDYGDPITSSAIISDTDGDGISDGDEFTAGTHPRDTDTDDDGLSDSAEPGVEGTTSPIDEDTDDDGLWDGDEVNTYGTNAILADSDGDGVPDGTEIDAGETTTAPADTDGDGLINAIDDDDDGDGVLTQNEEPESADGDPTNDDTDTDGIPNYLDNDDDGDGVLTANEDLNSNGNLADDDTDGDTIPNYLDNDNAPQAFSDTYTTTQGDTLVISANPNVLANDVDVDNDPLTATLVTGPSNSTSFSLNPDGSFTYVHDGTDTLSDTFTYQAQDNDLNDSNVATATITINPGGSVFLPIIIRNN